MTRRTLDLGCGPSPRNSLGADAFGIEYSDDVPKPTRDPFAETIVGRDLAIHDIPFPGHSFERVFAHDFLEHIPRIVYVPKKVILDGDVVVMPFRRLALIELFNEVYRVLEPGGVFETCTPSIHDVGALIGDPSHVAPWAENVLNYFCAQPGVNFEFDLMRRYGFTGHFRLDHKSYRHGSHLYAELVAVK